MANHKVKIQIQTHELVVLPKPRLPPKSNPTNTYRNVDLLTEAPQYQSLKTIRETENNYASLIRPPAQPQSTENLSNVRYHNEVQFKTNDPVSTSVSKKSESKGVAVNRQPIAFCTPSDEEKTKSSSTKVSAHHDQPLKVKGHCTPATFSSKPQVLKQTDLEKDGKGHLKHHLYQSICIKHKIAILAIAILAISFCILAVIVVSALILAVTGLIAATDGENQLKTKYDLLQQQFKELEEAMNSSRVTFDETLHSLSTNFQKKLLEEHSFFLNIITDNQNDIDRLSKKFTFTIALLTMKVKELTADTTRIKDNTSKLYNSVATLLGSIDNLNNRIGGAESSILTTGQRISNLRVQPFSNCAPDRKVSATAISNPTHLHSYAFSTPWYNINKLVSYRMKQKYTHCEKC